MDGSDDRDPLGGLENRLQSHAKAFESLLALTPAQDYYGSQIVDGKDPSEQWNRKKQTKEQKRAAKKAKLDPANQKSALDIMKEREAEAMKKKRKREGEEGDEGTEGGDEDGAEPVQATKRNKGEEDADAAEAKRRAKAEKRKEKRQQKKEKVEQKKEKAEAKKAAKQDKDLAEAQAENQLHVDESEDDYMDDSAEGEAEPAAKDADLGGFDFSGLAEPQLDTTEDADEAASEGSSAPSSPAVDSPAFDISANHSAASSSSSIMPPEEDEVPSKARQAPPQKPTIDTKAASAPPTQQIAKPTDPPSGISSPKIHLPDIDHDELQARVRKRIEELRAARKADGADGKPAKSRQELLDQRRKKGEQRKAAKKAQRQKQKEEEAQKREAQLRGSGSPLSADIFSPRSPQPKENNYSFSRLAFDDGTSADPSMTSLRDAKKTKGPSDPKTALQAAQKKQSRLAGYDTAKRAEIGEKDMWLHARQRAQGERVKDDTNLLKKALKRKEKQKGKSEKQWQEREQAVVKGREMKQKKRETNLAKRKEEKGGGKKKGKGGGKGAAGGGKKKGRPGFEGRFKA